MDNIFERHQKLEELPVAERVRQGWRGASYPWEIAELWEPDDKAKKEAWRLVIEEAIAVGDLKAESALRSDETFIIISPYLQVKVHPEDFVHWMETQGGVLTELPEVVRPWAFPGYESAMPVLTKANATREAKPSHRDQRRDQRIAAVRTAVEALGYSPKEIPRGGKAKLRDYCLKTHPKLFTESAFERAWQQAKKQDLIEVENPDQYR